MRSLPLFLGLLFLVFATAAGAQSPRMFENVLVTPQPSVAGQPVFATMVWIQPCDRLTLTGGSVSLAAPNVIRVRAEFEGVSTICFSPGETRVAFLPFNAPAAGTWAIDFEGTVRYRTSGGSLGPPVPITLRIPPPAVIINAPAAVTTASHGALAALAALLALIAWVSIRRNGLP